MPPKAAVLHPKYPERTCWGCDRFCSANDLSCGNGTVRTQHPVELLGDDWLEFAKETDPTSDPTSPLDDRFDGLSTHN
jgi:hypothetical protein